MRADICTAPSGLRRSRPKRTQHEVARLVELFAVPRHGFDPGLVDGLAEAEVLRGFLLRPATAHVPETQHGPAQRAVLGAHCTEFKPLLQPRLRMLARIQRNLRRAVGARTTRALPLLLGRRFALDVGRDRKKQIGHVVAKRLR